MDRSAGRGKMICRDRNGIIVFIPCLFSRHIFAENDGVHRHCRRTVRRINGTGDPAFTLIIHHNAVVVERGVQYRHRPAGIVNGTAVVGGVVRECAVYNDHRPVIRIVDGTAVPVNNCILTGNDRGVAGENRIFDLNSSPVVVDGSAVGPSQVVGQF